MLRAAVTIGLHLLGAALHSLADRFEGVQAEDDLVDAELPADGTPLTQEARAMIVPPTPPEKPEPEPPLEGSIEARLAKSRTFG